MAEKVKRKAGVLHSLFTGNTEHRLIFFTQILFRPDMRRLFCQRLPDLLLSAALHDI